MCIHVSLSVCLRKGTSVLMRSRKRQRTLLYESLHDVSFFQHMHTDIHTCLNKWSVSLSLLLYNDFGLYKGKKTLSWKCQPFSSLQSLIVVGVANSNLDLS